MKKLTLIIIALLMFAAQGIAQNQKWSQSGRPGSRGLIGTFPSRAAMDANNDKKPDVARLSGQEYWFRNRKIVASGVLNSDDGALVVSSGVNPAETWVYPLAGLQDTKVQLIGFFNVDENEAKEAILIGIAPDDAQLVLVVSQQGVQKVYSNYRLIGAGDLDGEPGDELLFYDPANDKIELWGK